MPPRRQRERQKGDGKIIKTTIVRRAAARFNICTFLYRHPKART